MTNLLVTTHIVTLPLFLQTILVGCSTHEPQAKPVSSLNTLQNSTVSSSSVVQTSGEATVDLNLGDYLWQNRLLLVFAPGENTLAYQQQMQNFETAQVGFTERDLLLIELIADGNNRLDGVSIDPSDAESVRSRYGIPAETFAVMLIGKDGTLKRHDSEPVLAEIIFDEIDAMPMRQREMHQSR